MPTPLQRGAVVVRDGRYGVVWVSGPVLTLLPVLAGPLRQRDRRGFDVPIELAELIAAGIALPEAVVRPECAVPADAALHEMTGVLPGRVMCRVVHQLARAAADEMARAKWSSDREHRVRAEERCVNLAR